MKNFCALPFHHVMIEPDGKYNICCQHVAAANSRSNIKAHAPVHWLDSEYVSEVRESFLKDQRHPGCENCWSQEDRGFESLRTRTAHEYQLLGVAPQTPVIKNIEVNLGNLCNLKCLMCNELNSSAILAENKQLGINLVAQDSLKWNDQAFGNLTDLVTHNQIRVLNIRGGEPFYNKQLLKLITDIPDEQAKSMMLHVSTNATVWNADWANALGRFKLVRMMFSVDGVGDLYEYIRYPGVWNVTQENIASICKLPNVKPLVYTVVQNLNIGRLSELVDWSAKLGLYHMFDVIHQPAHLQIFNLPEAAKAATISQLQALEGKYQAHVNSIIKVCINSLQNSTFDPVLWRDFLKDIVPRDKLRGNSYQKFIGE